MYVQGEMVENAHVLRGILNHERADTPGYETTPVGITIHRRVYVFSHTLGITGICDLLEEAPTADGSGRVQAGSQGQMEQRSGSTLCAGALSGGDDRQVHSPTGRSSTSAAVAGSRSTSTIRCAVRRAASSAKCNAPWPKVVIPPHTEHRARCRGCSLVDICLPVETGLMVNSDRVNDPPSTSEH